MNKFLVILLWIGLVLFWIVGLGTFLDKNFGGPSLSHMFICYGGWLVTATLCLHYGHTDFD